MYIMVRDNGGIMKEVYKNKPFTACNSGQILKRVQHDKRKVAFTLAETLIAIAIIGIVAALTIPPLVHNYQKMVWTNQLKKSYANLNKGFKLMMAVDGVDSLSQTEVFQSLNNGVCSNLDINYANNSNACKNFIPKFSKYFKIISGKTWLGYGYMNTYIREYENISYLKGTKSPYAPPSSVVTLADGTNLFDVRFKFNESTQLNSADDTCGYIGQFTIDINGYKKPNKYGRDIFQFIIIDTGIYPYGNINYGKYLQSHCNKYINPNFYYWRTTSSWQAELYGCKTSLEGRGCAGRVLEEGKMSY